MSSRHAKGDWPESEPETEIPGIGVTIRRSLAPSPDASPQDTAAISLDLEPSARPGDASGPYPWDEGYDAEAPEPPERLEHPEPAEDGDDAGQRYRWFGELGRGGMGRVFRALDTEIGRQVAVKVLLRGPDAPAEDLRRFWMEVQATGQLEHPAIIPIHDVGRTPAGDPFYVMKMLSGRTLAGILEALADGDPVATEEFPRAKLLTAFQQVSYAVAFAHARGVIHRDIKPSNIMIGRYGEAMLLDWGLAKLIRGVPDPVEHSWDPEPQVRLQANASASETAAGTITGTPQYMSPEATEGKPELVSEKSDVYGLGAVLYEILTLTPPFPDRGFVSTIVLVRAGEVEPPRARAPDKHIPVELEEVCLAAMQKDAAQRPSAKQLADDIGRALEGTRERARRAAEARERVREGRAAVERWKELRADLKVIETDAKALQKQVPPWADVSQKEKIWALEDRASALKVEAVGAFEEAEAAFQRALGEVADHREARSSLAALYYARFFEAERARDEEGLRYFSSLVARYDDGVWAKVLAGAGTLSVAASHPDVEVKLEKLGLVGRVLAPVGSRPLGKPPIEAPNVPIGSYVLRFEREGARDIVRPVRIGRMESVTVHVQLRDDAEIGDGFVLVPSGAAILGGDPIAHGCLERRVVNVPEVAVSRFPVTCREYLEFLNDVGLDEGQPHVPRVRGDEGYYWRWNAEARAFEFPPPAEGGLPWALDYPVFGVSYEDALAYVSWRRAKTGEKLRLPHEDEWEKAARGVDGRFFPWGDHFDATFCKMKESRNAPYPEPEAVGAYPIDCSPYGVRDMAGGVRELCTTEEDGRVQPVMRGGCWHDTGLFCRVAFRHVTKPDFVNTGLGFRVVKDLG